MSGEGGPGRLAARGRARQPAAGATIVAADGRRGRRDAGPGAPARGPADGVVRGRPRGRPYLDLGGFVIALHRPRVPLMPTAIAVARTAVARRAGRARHPTRIALGRRPCDLTRRAGAGTAAACRGGARGRRDPARARHRDPRRRSVPRTPRRPGGSRPGRAARGPRAPAPRARGPRRGRRGGRRRAARRPRRRFDARGRRRAHRDRRGRGRRARRGRLRRPPSATRLVAALVPADAARAHDRPVGDAAGARCPRVRSIEPVHRLLDLAARRRGLARRAARRSPRPAPRPAAPTRRRPVRRSPAPRRRLTAASEPERGAVAARVGGGLEALGEAPGWPGRGPSRRSSPRRADVLVPARRERRPPRASPKRASSRSPRCSSPQRAPEQPAGRADGLLPPSSP